MRPVRRSRVSQPFAHPGSYASVRDAHGAPGHHTGVDFGSAWPRPIERSIVRAPRRGLVVISEYNSAMGNWVGVFFPRKNMLVTYWHLDRRSVKVGQRVRRWTVLGRVGTTGNSTAPHLHVQANKGRSFDYHGHVRPPRWAAAGAWEVRALSSFLARRRRRK